jgi:hypothetical protein
VGLILALVATFWAQRNLYPGPLQEFIESEQSLTYEEQMRAAEVRAVARMLGADPREQAGIVRAAILESRARPQASVGMEPARAFETALIETLGAIAELEPIIGPDEGTDDYVDAFNTTLAYARALLILQEQKESSDVEDQLWRDSVSGMLGPLGMLVGSQTSFPNTYFLRLSDENPTALTAMVRLRAVGTRWLALTNGTYISEVPDASLLPQARTELIRLLQGKPDVSAARGFSTFPVLAEKTINQDFDPFLGPT